MHPEFTQSFEAFLREVDEDILKKQVNIEEYIRQLRKHALNEYNELFAFEEQRKTKSGVNESIGSDSKKKKKRNKKKVPS